MVTVPSLALIECVFYNMCLTPPFLCSFSYDCCAAGFVPSLFLSMTVSPLRTKMETCIYCSSLMVDVGWLIDQFAGWFAIFWKLRLHPQLSVEITFPPTQPLEGTGLWHFRSRTKLDALCSFVFPWLPHSVCLDSGMVLLCYILLCFYNGLITVYGLLTENWGDGKSYK